MTYIVGWKTKSDFFLCADMAVTKIGSNLPQEDDTKSSFGEKVYASPTKTIKESLPKIIKINDFLLFAAAGDLHLSNDILENLRTRIEGATINSENNLLEFLQKSIENSLLGDDSKKVQVIVGAIIGSKPVMITYNDEHNTRTEIAGDIAQIGSLADIQFYNYATLYSASIFFHKSAPAEKMLISMISVIQSYGIHDSLLESFGVGGAIAGVRLNDKGVNWQSNILYVVLDIPPSTSEVTSVINRDGTMITMDTAGDCRFFINTYNNSQFSNIETIPLDAIKTEMHSDTYNYIVFIHKTKRIIIVLFRRNFSMNSRYADLIFFENTIELRIEPELSSIFLEEFEKDVNSIPISFKFINDQEK